MVKNFNLMKLIRILLCVKQRERKNNEREREREREGMGGGREGRGGKEERMWNYCVEIVVKNFNFMKLL